MKYTVQYWYYKNDDNHLDEIEVEASSETEAIEKAKKSPDLHKHASKFKVVKPLKEGLTPGTLEKREKVMKDLKNGKSDFIKRYGAEAEKVMYGVATKRAKNQMENINKDRIREVIKSVLVKEDNSKYIEDMALKLIDFAGGKVEDTQEGSKKYSSFFSKNTIGETLHDKIFQKALELNQEGAIEEINSVKYLQERNKNTQYESLVNKIVGKLKNNE